MIPVYHLIFARFPVQFSLSTILISVRIADTGVGFQLPASMVDFMRMGHYGLSGIAEWVEMIGGTLAIQSAPGIGTVIEVSVDHVRCEL